MDSVGGQWVEETCQIQVAMESGQRRTYWHARAARAPLGSSRQTEAEGEEVGGEKQRTLLAGAVWLRDSV